MDTNVSEEPAVPSSGQIKYGANSFVLLAGIYKTTRRQTTADRNLVTYVHAVSLLSYSATWSERAVKRVKYTLVRH